LKAQGGGAGHNQVAASLRRQGLRAKAARKFKATTNSNHALPVAANLLNQDFTAGRRDEKWVSDITYVWTDEGWLYLAIVLDLYSRKVIGWSISERMTARLTCDALQMALMRRGRPRGVIAHSDRGSQYCAREYRALLSENGFLCSMSARGDCFGRVDDWRGKHTRRGVAVAGGAGASVRCMFPFPVAARRTGRADFPHPALTHESQAFAFATAVRLSGSW
jgi:transposase InsO family protein